MTSISTPAAPPILCEAASNLDTARSAVSVGEPGTQNRKTVGPQEGKINQQENTMGPYLFIHTWNSKQPVFVMDVWLNNHFPCKDFESSNWNNHL